jgi:hypothetical protein
MDVTQGCEAGDGGFTSKPVIVVGVCLGEEEKWSL